MNTTAKCVVPDTWTGRRYYAVEMAGETPKKARVRVLTPGGVMLPGHRYVQCGEIALVPKHAIKDMPGDAHKVEQGYYDGHVGGFGGRDEWGSGARHRRAAEGNRPAAPDRKEKQRALAA